MAKRSAECHSTEYTASIHAFAARLRGEKPAKVVKAGKAIKAKNPGLVAAAKESKKLAAPVKEKKAPKKASKKKAPVVKEPTTGEPVLLGTIPFIPDSTVPA